MPGENCAIVGCSTSRRHSGISIFKVPKANNDVNRRWGEALINIITKDREIDNALRKRIESRKLYICEMHFDESQYYTYGDRKCLKENELPRLNLPKKSSALPTFTRSTSSIEKRESRLEENSVVETFSPPPTVYKDYEEFVQRISKLSLPEKWHIEVQDSFVLVYCKADDYLLSEMEIFVDATLKFTIRVFGWILPVDHEIYGLYNRSCNNVTLSCLIKVLEGYSFCDGIQTLDPAKEACFLKHVIPKKFNFMMYQQSDLKLMLHQTEYYRSNNCRVFVNQKSSCKDCEECQLKFAYERNRKSAALSQPAKLNAPIKFTSPDRIKLTLQDHRLKCKQLEKQLEDMRCALQHESTPVDSQLDGDMKKIFSGCDKKDVPNFMKLFWDEQQKYIQSSTASSVRYHPMIIKFCLNLAAKSSSAYNDLRYDSKTGTGVIVLPSLRTLRDYKNYIHPTRGFNPAVIAELGKKTENFSGAERFVTILFDEMKIQEDLVWDKYSGELIGFVDLGDININYATLKNVQELATHILVFLMKSVVNPLSYSIASFATTGVNSYQIMPLFWKAVMYLEKIKLKVIAATADGASPNRKFFRMHKMLDGDSGKEVVYRAKNIHNKDGRYLYFFADVPHLIKTARNCLANSGSNRATRYMWNSGFFVLWSHVRNLYHDDLENGLKLVPKLTSDHINLTPHSVMRVRLAAQVLSESVSTVLNQFGPPEAAGTATFCAMIDKFFDCLNVRNTVEHTSKRKPFLKPYYAVDDPRFEWLDNFLSYFLLWKESIDERPGNFTDNAKSNMFISWQTYEGFQITVHSFKEVTKYLLQNGVEYVLSERFCQDDLENYFGRQRAIGRRRDNPTVKDAGYNDNTIKSQFSVRPIQGNVQGAVGKFNVIDDTPLPKRRK